MPPIFLLTWPIYFQTNNREFTSHVSNLSSVTEQKKLSPSNILEWLDSVQFRCSVMSALCDPVNHSMTGLPVHHQPPEFTNSCPLSQWCHPNISSSVVPFSSCPQSFPASGSFQMSQLFTSGGQSLSFNISPSNEHPGLISFRMDWLDLLAVQGTLKSLLQHHSSKASILQHSTFFIVQLSHPYMTTGKTIALTRQTFVDKVMSAF